ncbi:MAG: YciI family protein [Cyanobacteria bacterium LVE1205-1]|jgi:uncharacterized protein YciI
MPKYVMYGNYCHDVIERRVPYRQSHLDGLAAQKEEGSLIAIGPTKDLTRVFAIYDAPDEATVRRLVESDAYWQNGVWTEYHLYEWIQVY